MVFFTFSVNLLRGLGGQATGLSAWSGPPLTYAHIAPVIGSHYGHMLTSLLWLVGLGRTGDGPLLGAVLQFGSSRRPQVCPPAGRGPGGRD
eukprot:7131715-Pyramimonas_sp.AAC.1